MFIYFQNNIFLYRLVLFSFLFFSFFLSFLKLEASVKCDLDSVNKAGNETEAAAVRDACDTEIKEARTALAKKQGETSGVKYEIKKLDQEIRLSKLYVNQKLAIANRLNNNISSTEDDIENLGIDLEKVNETLKVLIFQRSQTEANTALEAILSKNTISEFFEDNDTSRFLEAKISDKITRVKKERDTLQRLTIELEEKESVERDLANERKSETLKIKKNKKYKDELLGILKKEEGGLQVTLSNKERAKRAILSKVFTLASGDKVSFGEAYGVINPYKKALGMDPAFVLAILFQESGFHGKIGGNIGRCTYKQKNSNGNATHGYTVMKKNQQKNFLAIMSGIGVDADTQKISCPIPSDGSYGGAMGPAQFMPNT
jgi:hypothetical protein